MQNWMVTAVASTFLFVLAACGDTDLERGVSGAAIGAVGSAAVDGDPLTGALIGGAAGVLCDDVTPDLCR